MLFNNSLKKFGAIVLGVGLLMLVFNLVMVLRSNMFMATSESTTGYVKDVESRVVHNNNSSRNRSVQRTTVMTIEYAVDGVVYEKSFKVGNASANEGTPITVYYKKGNPENASTGKEAITVDGFVIFLVLFFGVLIYLKGTEED